MEPETKTFTHSTGSFSFQYPSNYKITEGDGFRKVVTMTTDGSDENTIKLEVKHSPNYLPDLDEKIRNGSDAKKLTKLIGQYSVTTVDYPELGTAYNVSVDSSKNPSNFIVVLASNDTSKNIVNGIIETLTIDRDKMWAHIESIKANSIPRDHIPGEALPGEF
jgi:hypothetical protein